MAHTKGLVVSIEKDGWAKVVTRERVRVVAAELHIAVTLSSQTQR